MCPAASGVAQGQPDEPFRILITNVDQKPKHLFTNRNIRSTEYPATKVFESEINHADLLGKFEEVNHTLKPSNHKDQT